MVSGFQLCRELCRTRGEFNAEAQSGEWGVVNLTTKDTKRGEEGEEGRECGSSKVRECGSGC